jgi:hypothetical protein
MADVQTIIERLARGEISEAEAAKQLEVIWESAYHASLFKKILRELLPSLAHVRRST